MEIRGHFISQVLLTSVLVLLSQSIFATKFGGATISGTTSVCNTMTVLTANITTCNGSSHSIVSYQWQESDDNGVGDAWANAVGGSGSTTASYTTPTLTADIYYRVIIDWSGASCNGVSDPYTSGSQLIDAAATPTTADAGTDQNIGCTSTATLAGNTATVGTGTWSVVSGTATITTPSSPTSGVTGIGGAATLRWTIANSPCASSTDDVIITSTLNATGTYPAGGAVCYNTSTSLTLTGSSGTIQWQESDDNGVGDAWANAVGGSGATTATYTTPNLTTPIYYRAELSGGACGAVYTTGIYIAVGPNGGEIWLGGTSTDWFTHANWCSADPTSTTTDIMIPANTTYAPIITGSADVTCRDVTINAGATVEHANSGDWMIYGNMVNNGTLDHSGSINCTTSYGYWILMRGTAKTWGGSGDFTNVAWCTDGTSTITLSSDVSYYRQWINSSGTLSLSSYTAAVSYQCTQHGDLYLNTGTLELGANATDLTFDATDWHEETGTVYLNRSGSAWSTIPNLTYYNLKIANFSGFTNLGNGSETILNNLELVQGTAGGTYRHQSTSLAIGNNLSVAAGVTFDLDAATAEDLDIGGDLTNNGTITCRTSTSINLAGDWTDNGTFTKSTSAVIFDGTTTQNIGGTATTDFYDVTLSNSITDAKGANLTSDISFSGTMTVSMANGGDFDLNGKTLTIATGTTAAISGESDDDRIYGAGKITHTETVSSTAAYDFGGMGVTITPAAADYPGVTTIDRVHTAQNNGGSSSIIRYFDITAADSDGLNLTGKFEYFDSELNGNASDANMTVYKSTDGGTTWSDMTGTWTDNGTNDYVSKAGITGFSRWVVSNATSDNLALPIQLAEFTATPEKDVVELTWLTLAELNNNKFVIERSEDNQEWEELGNIEGAGTSNEPLSYEYTDYNPVIGTSYYKLTSFDFNGESTQTAVRKVDFFKDSELTFSVFPNPGVQEDVFVVIEGLAKEEEVLVSLVDMLGNQVYSKVVITDANGQAFTALDQQNRLIPGVYTVIGSSLNTLYSKKLIIQ